MHPSLGLSKPNKCISPLGLYSVEPANKTGPFKTARKTPSGSIAIQKCDTTKGESRSCLAEMGREKQFDS